MLAFLKSLRRSSRETPARPAAWTVSRQYEGILPAFAQRASLAGIDLHVVSSAVLDVTREHLRDRGTHRAEGALCWAGSFVGRTALVTTALVFTQAGRHGCIHVSSAHTGLLYAHCHARGLTLLAQVHSHPFAAGHSDVDEELPHSAEPGFLSIVVPNFGAGAFDAFGEWCFFEQVAYERWREWSPREKLCRLRVIDSVVAVP